MIRRRRETRKVCASFRWLLLESRGGNKFGMGMNLGISQSLRGVGILPGVHFQTF